MSSLASCPDKSLALRVHPRSQTLQTIIYKATMFRAFRQKTSILDLKQYQPALKCTRSKCPRSATTAELPSDMHGNPTTVVNQYLIVDYRAHEI